MKRKKKTYVSENSDTNGNDNFGTPSKNSSQSYNYPKKKPAKDNDSRLKFTNEVPKLEVEQVLENELNSENSSDENINNSVSTKSIFIVEELTCDDEIYTLQCPENCIKQLLCNRNIDFTKLKQSVICNDEVFQLELLNSEKKFITLAVPKKTCGGSLIKKPLKGHIVIHKVVEPLDNKPKIDNEGDICDNHKVVYPDDVKMRHPLLGVEWKAHIDSANEAFKKQNYFKNKSKKVKEKSSEIEIKNLKRERNNPEVVQKKKRRTDF